MYFLALTFSPHYLLFKRLESFRRRYDPSYAKTKLLHMTLLSPFSPSQRIGVKGLMEHLEEMLDDYLCGHGDDPLEFNQLNYSYGRKGTLYLEPVLTADFEHCIEGLMEELSHCEVRFKRKRANLCKPYLPLGRYLQKEEVYHAYKQAHGEFPLPLLLQPHKIVLFEKGHGVWSMRGDLFTFEASGHNEMVSNSSSFSL